jgi:hypothetical protein
MNIVIGVTIVYFIGQMIANTNKTMETARHVMPKMKTAYSMKERCPMTNDQINRAVHEALGLGCAHEIKVFIVDENIHGGGHAVCEKCHEKWNFGGFPWKDVDIKMQVRNWNYIPAYTDNPRLFWPLLMEMLGISKSLIHSRFQIRRNMKMWPGSTEFYFDYEAPENDIHLRIKNLDECGLIICLAYLKMKGVTCE